MFLSMTTAVHAAIVSTASSTNNGISSVWVVTLPALIAIFGIVLGNIVTHLLGIRAGGLTHRRDRKYAIYLELRGMAVTYSQMQYTCYEVGVNTRVHEALWKLDEKNTFQRDQAIYYSRKHDELTISVAQEAKLYYEKLGEARLLFADNNKIQENLDEIEKIPLYVSDDVNFVADNMLMQQKNILLDKYKNHSDEFYRERLLTLSQLIREELQKSNQLKQIIIESMINVLRRFL